MKITDSEVLYVSRLAKLRLDTDEMKRFQKELNAILEYMDLLKDVDTSDVPPTSHTTTIMNALREDTVQQSQKREDALLNAPEHKDGNIIVPKVID